MIKMSSCLRSVGTFIVFLPAVLFADGNADTKVVELDEVVVTADYLDTELQDLPSSVVVIDEKLIERRQARNLEEVISTAPNVHSSSGASRARFFQIRGIGELEQFVDPISNPSVGVVVDGVEMSGLHSPLFDVDQVEVLRGPQGTRFGTSAMGGLINVRSVRPTKETEGYAEVGVGHFGSRNGSAAIGGALGDDLQARIAIQQNKSDGYIENIHLGRDNTNDIHETSIRGQLQWQASNRSEFYLSALYMDFDNGYDAWSFNDTKSTRSDNPGHDRQITSAFTLENTLELNHEKQLFSQFTWQETDTEYGYDDDWAYDGFDPAGFSNTDNYIRNRRNLSADIRLTSDSVERQWVAGLFFRNRDESLNRSYWGPFESDYKTQNAAAYGQWVQPLSDRLSLRTGLRLEHFEEDYDDDSFAKKSSDKLWGADLSLSYAATEATTIYGLVSRGYKPGGVNSSVNSNLNAGIISDDYQGFLGQRRSRDKENVYNFELGTKGRYFDQSLLFRMALFYMYRENAQLEGWLFDSANMSFSGYTDNAENARNHGLELETNYFLSDEVEFFANVALLETELGRFTVLDPGTAAFIEQENRDQANAPKYQFNLGANISLLDNLQWHFEIEGRDEFFFASGHNKASQSYELIHTSLNYSLDQLEMTLWVRNLTDQDYAVRGFYFGNDPRKGYVAEPYQQLGSPRTFGLNAKYSF